MTEQSGDTSALLPFLMFAPLTEKLAIGQKKGAEHKRDMDHAGSLLQSPLTYTSGVLSYTAFIPQSVAATRRFLHHTTLSCLPSDKNVDAEVVHNGNLTEGSFHAAATC